MDPSKLIDDITASEDIAQFGELSDIEIAEENIQSYIENKLDSSTLSPSAAALIKDNPQTAEQLVFSEDKGFIYYVAFNFYKELIKQAKRFNKAYCRIHGMVLSGQRNLKYPGIGQKYNKDFNPFLYSMHIRSKDASDTEKKLLTNQNVTPDEASLKAAYALGFLDSYEYKSIPQMFHIPTVEKILSDSQWLSSIRKQAQYTEEMKQVRNAYYLHPLRKIHWMEEIQNKLQEEVYKMKGSV